MSLFWLLAVFFQRRLKTAWLVEPDSVRLSQLVSSACATQVHQPHWPAQSRSVDWRRSISQPNHLFECGLWAWPIFRMTHDHLLSRSTRHAGAHSFELMDKRPTGQKSIDSRMTSLSERISRKVCMYVGLSTGL
ncbi:unnamed protein product [Protopolystoma xenopodis]|uniref:Secreted protein n=1 Tax=Protopolystoma xenopodis TaxID=117903 RepID=A0A448X3T3_9PLAT|nr:unnamed protein product [Protopolystoma xenopodis]